MPWLGYSPDGIVFENGKPHCLVEIKCPVLGENISIFDLARTNRLKFLAKDEQENYILKERHTYYGQIQLGMALTGIDIADLACYSKIDSGVLLVRVERNEVFIENLLSRLKWVYFLFILPKLNQIHRKC